jgi:hypothetical protein
MNFYYLLLECYRETKTDSFLERPFFGGWELTESVELLFEGVRGCVRRFVYWLASFLYSRSVCVSDNLFQRFWALTVGDLFKDRHGVVDERPGSDAKVVNVGVENERMEKN